MGTYKYFAKPGAPKSTVSPVWAQQASTSGSVPAGTKKNKDGKPEIVYAEYKPGDMVFRASLEREDNGLVLPAAEFEALYDRMP